MDTATQKKWLKQIATIESKKTPVLVTDLSIIRQKITNFKQAMPRVKIMYAVKAYSDPVLLNEIADMVDGFDIASHGELVQLKKAIPKFSTKNQSILYSNPVKIPYHIEDTFKAGVNRFAFDSIGELKKLAEFAPGSEVYLRIKVSDHGSSFPLSKKFGAESVHAVALFGMAEDLGLKPIGLTFHVGSQSENLRVWENAIQKSSELIALLEKAGFKISLLDIGGGFPARYSEEVANIYEIGEEVQDALNQYISEDVEVVAEPGRYIVAESSVLVSTVIARESRAGQEWLYLDVGVFQGLMECLEMEDWKYPIFTEKTHKSSALPGRFTLTGPTCDAYDTIGFDIPLPSGIKIGERIVIGSAGAYTVVYESEFNGFSTPERIFINKK